MAKKKSETLGDKYGDMFMEIDCADNCVAEEANNGFVLMNEEELQDGIRYVRYVPTEIVTCKITKNLVADKG